jgi:hypothetical protein
MQALFAAILFLLDFTGATQTKGPEWNHPVAILRIGRKASDVHFVPGSQDLFSQ